MLLHERPGEDQGITGQLKSISARQHDLQCFHILAPREFVELRRYVRWRKG
jgi:hypothetical protein